MDFEIELRSDSGADYTHLRDLLAAANWREADEETGRVMLEAGNFKGKNLIELIDDFPCQDLQIIDELWFKYSNGRFGFSVQKKIYIDLLGGTKNHNREVWKKFGGRVGWRKRDNWFGLTCYWLAYKDITFELLDTTPTGHLPFLRKWGNAPVFEQDSDWGQWSRGQLFFPDIFYRIKACNL